MVPDFATAIAQAVCMAALGLFGGYTLTYAALAFFAVVEHTAAGQDQIVWPDEPLVDRLVKAATLAWVVAVGLAPAFLVGRVAAGEQTAGGWIFALAVLGLVFPVFLLSVEMSGSPVLILYTPALGRLSKRSDVLACYYLAVAPAYAAGAFAFWLLGRPSWFYVIPAAFLVSYALLLSARLLGRLAHKVAKVKLKERPSPAEAVAGPPRRRRLRTPDAADDPDAVYAVTDREPADPAPRPSLKRLWVEEGADDPYALSDGGAEKLPPQELPRGLREPSEYEMRLATRNRPVPAPKHLWLAGTYTFPLRPENWSMMTGLTAGFTVSALFARFIARSAAAG